MRPRAGAASGIDRCDGRLARPCCRLVQPGIEDLFPAWLAVLRQDQGRRLHLPSGGREGRIQGQQGKLTGDYSGDDWTQSKNVGTEPHNLRSGHREQSVSKMPEEDQRAIAARYRQSADALRGIAATLRFDPRRRAQLLALSNGFDRAAALIEKQFSENRE